MISNHKCFIEAVEQKKKVCLRFYSKPDSGVIDLVCAPMDYGPVGDSPDCANCYMLWDYRSNGEAHLLVLLSEQIVSMSVLGTDFDPAVFGPPPPNWYIPRDWNRPAGTGTEMPATTPVMNLGKQVASDPTQHASPLIPAR